MDRREGQSGRCVKAGGWVGGWSLGDGSSGLRHTRQQERAILRRVILLHFRVKGQRSQPRREGQDGEEELLEGEEVKGKERKEEGGER